MTDSDDAQRWRGFVDWIRKKALAIIIGAIVGAGLTVLAAARAQGDQHARIEAAADAITRATADRASITARVRALEADLTGVRSEVRLLIRWTVPRQAWPAGMGEEGDDGR